MALERPTVVLIGGNRGAGKNTFADTLCTPVGDKTDFRFDIFCISSIIGSTFSFPRSSQYVQLSFAQSLKKHVASLVGIPFETVEALKDQPMTPTMLENYSSSWFQPPESSAPTLRDALIDTAAKALVHNPTFYASTVYEQEIVSSRSGSVFLITDWRYKAEYYYFKTLEQQGRIKLHTCRVINKNAQPIDVPSERNLDGHLPQYIIQPSQQSVSTIILYYGAAYHLFHFTG
jgi:hypothetical protein